MIYLATGPAGEITLPSPVRIRLDRDADAPADGFEGTFPLPAGGGQMTGLTVYDETGNIFFDGIVDEQEEDLTGGTLSLSGRSRAALLLDNEALPQNYVNPSLATVFDRHIRPYGFTRFLGDEKSFTGTLAVTKGMSEWAAAAAFCSRFLKTEPRIANGIFDASGSAPEYEFVFGKSGIRFSSGLARGRYCELYSELYMMDPDGGTYTLSARSDDAAALSVARRRFLSAGTDVSAVLKKAGQSAFTCVLDCPGAVSAPLLSPARITEPPSGFEKSLCVSALRYLLDAEGEHTRITLRRE
ncbi:hypothetical protein EQM14_01250 [Caproiciproducens sp. NJN-50]|uniref:hypothetical protein n=1 Tax=Acutalibacteraceae TaxID=3082771 RepID=UPI000FFE0F57|nr:MULTISPECIES: hypothetical protein [Acutalibacteraceae]QAT48513.1 hypothetical protein EQM14_01250 [Caproiciproducens sp. NJN-50]